MKNNFIVAIVGESGNGKSSVVDILKESFHYSSIDSYTTRLQRYVGEGNHIFITSKEFEEWDKDEFCAYTYFNNNHYFATVDQLYSNELYVVDPSGVQYLKDKVKNTGMKVITVHISASEGVRAQRMATRGDTRLQIESRIKNDKKMFDSMSYNYSIENIDIKKTTKIIDSIIKTEIGYFNILKIKLNNVFDKMMGKLHIK